MSVFDVYCTSLKPAFFFIVTLKAIYILESNSVSKTHSQTHNLQTDSWIDRLCFKWGINFLVAAECNSPYSLTA